VIIEAQGIVDPLVGECETIYKEANDLMEALKPIGEEGSWTIKIKAQFIKLRWVFQKSRIEVLNRRLRSFEGHLHLLLSTVDLEIAVQQKLPADVMFVTLLIIHTGK